jgi:hypothetical protein
MNLRLAVDNFLSTKDSLVYFCFNLFQFFKAEVKTNGPGKFLYWYCNQTLKDLLVFAQPGVLRPIFYQELISFPNQVAQFKWSCKCVYRNREVRLHADYSGTVQDLVTILNFRFNLSNMNSSLGVLTVETKQDQDVLICQDQLLKLVEIILTV